jgi:hypothetical protein
MVGDDKLGLIGGLLPVEAPQLEHVRKATSKSPRRGVERDIEGFNGRIAGGQQSRACVDAIVPCGWATRNRTEIGAIVDARRWFDIVRVSI